jgi:retron-type reverse transcriptase
LEFDIRGLFDNIPHELLLKAVDKHATNPWVKLYIRRWLTAPLMSPDGRTIERTKGTPQGAVISPLLANIYLHYYMDLWINQWRKRQTSGDVIVVRYADDAVLGFQRKDDAEAFLSQLHQRLDRFGLSLNEDKTKLIRFGRFARNDCATAGLPKPESFDFSGVHAQLCDLA